MLSKVIDHINTILETEVKHCLAEIIEQGEKSLPAVWTSKDNFTPIKMTKSTSYHRLTGPVARTEEESPSVGCGLTVTDSYPLRLVVLSRKDGIYTELDLAQAISSSISDSNNKTLSKELGVQTVAISVTAYGVDRNTLWEEENTGVKLGVPFAFGYFSIEYSLLITGDISCMSCKD